jgi:hypothetical protein
MMPHCSMWSKYSMQPNKGAPGSFSELVGFYGCWGEMGLFCCPQKNIDHLVVAIFIDGFGHYVQGAVGEAFGF